MFADHERATRLDRWLPALLLAAGSVVFLAAGRLHPIVNSATMPEAGSADYFRAFAATMLQMHNWESVHLGILVGPVLWAIAAAGAVRALPARTAALGDIGRQALLLGATLWAIAFVLDGYVGPRLAAAIAAAGVGNDAVAINAFQANQLTMARLGTLSVVLMAVAALIFGAALLAGATLRSWRMGVGVLGIAVGAWPMIAAATGEFYPAPFTSTYWSLTALSFGVWFLLFGVALVRGGRAPRDAVRAERESLSPRAVSS